MNKIKLIISAIVIFLLVGCSNNRGLSMNDIKGMWTRETMYGVETYDFSENGEFIYDRDSSEDSHDLHIKYIYKLVRGENGNSYLEMSNCETNSDENYCGMFNGRFQIDMIDGNLNFVGNVTIELKRSN